MLHQDSLQRTREEPASRPTKTRTWGSWLTPRWSWFGARPKVARAEPGAVAQEPENLPAIISHGSGPSDGKT